MEELKPRQIEKINFARDIALSVLSGRDHKFKVEEKDYFVTALKYGNDYSKKITLLASERHRAYIEFGYKCMKDFITENTDDNYNKINRKLVAARVAFNMGGIQMIDKFSDTVLYQMAKLTMDQCFQVIEYINLNPQNDNSSKLFSKQSVLNAMVKLGFRANPINRTTRIKRWKRFSQASS